MKVNFSVLGRISRRSGFLVALALAALLPLPTRAADETAPMKPMKGGEHMLMLKEITSKKDVDALKTGDTIAMVCAKCKTVWTTRVKQGVKGAEILNEHGHPIELIGTHGCNGCNSAVTITGSGKGKEMTLKHTCAMCGDESAFCCVTKAGDGSTKGMEKK